jgi:hypothetical protein
MLMANGRITDDGGPAFPRPIGNNGRPHFEDSEISSEQEGMSLRDYFAGQAIVGCGGWPGTGLGPGESFQQAAEVAYRVADAMVKARAAKAEA